MHLFLVIRHGAAEDAAASGRDEDRTLTEEGAAEMERIASGLAATMRPADIVLTSPLRRARETAEIVGRAFGGVRVVDESVLAGSATPADLLSAVVAHCRHSAGRIAMVGHEPDLGRFVSYALAATSRSFHSLRKGGACLLEFPALPRAGNATLEWALEPAHLRALANWV